MDCSNCEDLKYYVETLQRELVDAYDTIEDLKSDISELQDKVYDLQNSLDII